jgi:hypothetical protein
VELPTDAKTAGFIRILDNVDLILSDALVDVLAEQVRNTRFLCRIHNIHGVLLCISPDGRVQSSQAALNDG